MQDVEDAVAASPVAEEVVVVIPQNVDRDGPKKKSVEWLSKAKAAAGKAFLRVIDGRELSSSLDRDHQDLRWKYLQIPYSRLTASSLLISARVATESVVDQIRASGRYDPGRYAVRCADGELYRIWQTCLQQDKLGERRIAPVRMISLVNDAGVGKTSLVCSFAQSLGAVLPVVLLQARDLMFSSEDALVARCIHALQGVLDAAFRVVEEAALVKHIAGTMPLTLILDGLDETHNPDAVRRAITYWLMSRIGQASVLVVTSRPEFWRTCFDPSWNRWMPRPATDEDNSPRKVFGSSRDESLAGYGETRLPDRFSEAELEAAWVRGEQPRADLQALSGEAREELRHPFTLRVYLDLLSQGDVRPLVVTRSDLLERWLNRRLESEAVPAERITAELFQQALRMLAARIEVGKGGSISVDEFRDAPRFDPTRPPGPVVQRLIDGNVLETTPDRPDRIRFMVEAVQDFYRAEADVEDIRADPEPVAKRFAELRFTDASPRLARIGRRLAKDDFGHAFVRRLAEIDSRMAAVVLTSAPLEYPQELRAKVTQALGGQIPSRHRVRAAFAITTLGHLCCAEAIEALERYLFPPAELHDSLRTYGAKAFVELGHRGAAEFVYRWRWEWVNPDYYFIPMLSLLRHASPELRCALADQAVRHLGEASGTREHAKAVCLLAYLADERLIEHLCSRMAENGLLEDYENHALLALGTDEAGALFAKSVRAVGELLATVAANDPQRSKLIDSVWARSADVRYLVTPAFGKHFLDLIEDQDWMVSLIGRGFARSGHITSLLHSVAVSAAKHRRIGEDVDSQATRSAVTPDLWLEWWRATTDVRVRQELLKLLPLYPTPSIEEVLLECLDSSELQGRAARQLGEYGAVRSAAQIRQILKEEDSEETLRVKTVAADALGRLRDEAAIPLLQTLAASHPNSDAALFASASLGFIGTSEAETALSDLLLRGVSEHYVINGLMLCGSPSAVAASVARAKEKPEGLWWLCEQLGYLSWVHGWTRGQYYTHIHTADLVEYLDAVYQPGSPAQNWSLVDSFRQIDSPDVRRLLRKWAARRGTPEDPIVRENDQRRVSDLAYWELTQRGDESAIGYILDDKPRDKDDNVYVHIAEDQLRHFRSSAVAAELRRRIELATTNSELVRMLSLLGQFGDSSDDTLLRNFLTHENELIANVACESLLRLTDPLLVPEDWREV